MSDKPRILVVEDDRSSRIAMLALLRLGGFEPLEAHTVAEALKLIGNLPICLILDLMLPDGNGSTVLEQIRARDLPIRVAITTGAADWKKMVDPHRLRPDAVFQKPIDFLGLSNWLKGCANTLDRDQAR